MNAVRFDKKEVITGKTHIDIVFEYMKRENLTDDEMDAMIDADRLEFGSAFLNNKMELEFSTDKTRTEVYDSLFMLHKCKRL